MPREVLYATGVFDIGDQFYDSTGMLRTVTNVLVCHNIRRGTFKVLYELDDSGKFEEVSMQGFGKLPSEKTKPVLQFVPTKKQKDPFFGGGEEP